MYFYSIKKYNETLKLVYCELLGQKYSLAKLAHTEQYHFN